MEKIFSSILNFDESFKICFVAIFILVNIIFYIVYKFSKQHKIFHVLLSTIDNISLITFASCAVYQANHYFVILVPCFLLFIIYPISYGMNKDLSDDDKVGVVVLRGFARLFLPWKVQRKVRIVFIELLTFPFYYLTESWRQIIIKNPEQENQGTTGMKNKFLILYILVFSLFCSAFADTISTRFNPPAGFTRVQANGFGEFLRSYPLLQDGSPVLLYDGSKKWNQRAHTAVFDMKLVRGDLQQCADSCMRLYAEYFYKAKQYEKIAFHLVNGFLVDFETWRKGGRVSVSGNKTEWVMNASPSDSQETFEKYLAFVFAYASTLSMEKESQKIDVKEIRAGDFFIQGGSPGHVVMVLDVCQNERGEKAFLLGQGYMPAQQFHVLKNPLHENDPWYYESELQFPLATPEYTFGEGSLKRPMYEYDK